MFPCTFACSRNRPACGPAGLSAGETCPVSTGGGGRGGGRSGFATAAPCCSAHLDFALHPLLRHKVVVHPVGLSAGTFCVKIDSTLSKKEAKSDLAAEKVLVSARLGTFGRALMRPGQRRFRFAGRAAKAGRLGRRAGGPTSPGRGSRVVCDTLKPTCSRTRPNAQAAAPPRQGSRAAPQPPPPPVLTGHVSSLSPVLTGHISSELVRPPPPAGVGRQRRQGEARHAARSARRRHKSYKSSPCVPRGTTAAARRLSPFPPQMARRARAPAAAPLRPRSCHARAAGGAGRAKARTRA